MIPSRFNRFSAWVNVITHLILFDGLLRIIAPILFTPAYLLRWMGKKNPLWIFGEDDTDWMGVPEERIKSRWKFLVAFNECAIRNVCDNLQQKLFLKGGYENIWFAFGGPDTRMLRAKFYNTDPEDVHNKGTYLSFKYSYFGRKKYFFKRSGRWYVLYSMCSFRRSGDKWKVREVNIGASDRILIRNKYQTAR